MTAHASRSNDTDDLFLDDAATRLLREYEQIDKRQRHTAECLVRSFRELLDHAPKTFDNPHDASHSFIYHVTRISEQHLTPHDQLWLAMDLYRRAACGTGRPKIERDGADVADVQRTATGQLLDALSPAHRRLIFDLTQVLHRLDTAGDLTGTRGGIRNLVHALPLPELRHVLTYCVERIADALGTQK
jgi:hypothetical protein